MRLNEKRFEMFQNILDIYKTLFFNLSMHFVHDKVLESYNIKL